MQYRIPEVADLAYKVGFLRGVEVIAADLRPARERDGIPPRDSEAAATLLFSLGDPLVDAGKKRPSGRLLERNGHQCGPRRGLLHARMRR